MNRFRQWWADEINKLRELSPRERVSYIWGYYRLWIIGFLSFCFVLSWGIHQYITTSSDSWFFACFANTRADLGDGRETFPSLR